MSSSSRDGTTYEWNVSPLTEMSEIIVKREFEPDRRVTLGTLIAMTNGDILDIIPESALALS